MTPQVKKFCFILVPLLVVVIAGTLVLIVLHTMTQDRITENRRLARLRVLDTVMPLPYNNNLYDDEIQIENSGIVAGNLPLDVFRARHDGKPLGIVIMPVYAKGYSGNIELIIGIDVDGKLLAVRTLKHRESRGLGDQIDYTKSDWIGLFTGLSLANPPVSDWAVTADGGKIDQISGATVTSRGVVTAVRKSLEFYRANRDKLY